MSSMHCTALQNRMSDQADMMLYLLHPPIVACHAYNMFSDFIIDSMSSAADTPSKGPEEGSVRPVGSAFQDLAQPEAASPGTYAATATPFQGGSHSILAPSIGGKPSLEEAGPGPGQGASAAGNNSLTATQPAADPQPVRFACATQN
jgi:hypothetical protein